MKLLAAKEWNKVWTERDAFSRLETYRIKVRSDLVHRDGNSNAYFSITAEIDCKRRNNTWREVSGGCLHNEILAHFPELQPLVDIHLSDEDGVPMHAYANAAYWAGHTRWEKDSDTLAKHLRVSKDQANEMTTYINHHYGEFDKITTANQAWKNTCLDFDLPNYWYKQAQEAKSMLNQTEVAQ